MAVNQQLKALAQRPIPGSQVIDSWQLTGGVSARVTAIAIREQDGSQRKLVLRQYGEADVASNPKVAETEFRVLKLLHERAIPVPMPLFADSSRKLFPEPILVIEFVEGGPDFEPADLDSYLQQLADQLLNIHRAGRTTDDLSFLPQRESLPHQVLRERLPAVDETLHSGNLDRLSNIEPATTANLPTLLHGDYWPGNVHWKHGRIVAVIDWEDARLGDPLIDVANCRLEVLWAFGNDAMDRFTKRYRAASAIDFTSLPYWDLCVAVGPAANYASWTDDQEVTERRRRRHRWFIREALRQLR